MRQGNLSIHSENILPIIKKWLYSEKEIFLRELVSNACDALSKTKMLRDQGLVAAQDEEFKISITVDKSNKTVSIEDTGIGMTELEVEKYIAQIAFSGAEEFLSQHKDKMSEPIIGHFGLGFYSAYMVATKVDIDTFSYQNSANPVFWSSDGSTGYNIGSGSRTTRGTKVTLHLDEENLEYLEESKLRELCNRFCRFLPYPIEINEKPLGNQTPLWMKSSADCSEKEYLDFHHTLFPLDPDPIFWIHLNVDFPFHLQGILFFPKLQRLRDAKESSVQLYCNRVFVAENCKDILPDYLMMLRGAIDCPDIPLNVSRSALQVDKNVRALGAHISKKISDRLNTLYRADREKFISYWSDIDALIKFGVLQDDKFYDRVKDLLIWKTSKNTWSTAQEYLERNPGKKIFYASEDRTGPLLQAYLEKNIEVLFANAHLDTAIVHFLEEKLECKFQRVDGALHEELLDPSKEKTVLDADGKSESAKIASLIHRFLGASDVDVEAKSLSSPLIPGAVLLREEERRMRDYLTLTGNQPMLHLLKKKTFVVNTNSKLIQTIVRLQDSQPEIAAELAKHVYELSLLSQKELSSKDAEGVLSRQAAMLEKLAGLI